MYTELISTAKSISKVAKNREALSDKALVIGEETKIIAFKEYTDRITGILSALSLSDIVDLQAVMFLGKESAKFAGQSPEKAYQEIRDELILAGLKGKEIEIMQIAKTKELCEYLTAGYKALGIEL